MKVLDINRTRYERTQVKASQAKFGYCKFSYQDAQKYVSLILKDKLRRKEDPNIGAFLSLGVRNGRKVDCFRTAAHFTPKPTLLTHLKLNINFI